MRKLMVPAFFAVLLTSGPSFAQFFAYANVGALDASGQPVIDAQTGKQIESGFCLLWRAGWVLDNPDSAVLDGKFYTSISFRADPQQRQITIYKAEAPGVVAITSGTGWYPVGGTVVFPLNVSVPMYPQPQPGWPCSQQDWQAVLSIPERQYPGTPVVLPSAGGRTPSSSSTPARPPFAVCKSPNWPGFRC